MIIGVENRRETNRPVRSMNVILENVKRRVELSRRRQEKSKTACAR